MAIDEDVSAMFELLGWIDGVGRQIRGRCGRRVGLLGGFGFEGLFEEAEARFGTHGEC